SAAYALLLAVRGESYAAQPRLRRKDVLVALVALLYAIWLLYAGGLKYLLLSALLYAPGVILFARAKHEQRQTLFTTWEKLIFAAVLAGAALAAYALYSGLLSL
ncbi:arginine-ornithine antiporter, partial [Pseudomonas juntendi]|nr:arginine-ornithine antiporter [Pseudomonas juntendi]